MHKRRYYLVNGITFYRLITAPLLVYLIFFGNINLFKWLLVVSFLTDAIDGYLARKFKVVSVFGARLDSIADDLTILAATIGLFVLKYDFIKEQMEIIILLLSLFAIQNIVALVKYHRITSFHTYIAKAAAVFQAVFLILTFLLPEPNYTLFYLTATLTAIDLAEEIVLVFLIPEWRANVKGLFWVLKE